MDSSNVVDDKPPNKRQRCDTKNGGDNCDGPIPIRKIYVGGIERDVEVSKQNTPIIRENQQDDISKH